MLSPLGVQAKQQHRQREEELLRQKEAAAERGEAIKQRRLQEEAEREAAALHAWQVRRGLSNRVMLQQWSRHISVDRGRV
jgi:hypothetical protein